MSPGPEYGIAHAGRGLAGTLGLGHVRTLSSEITGVPLGLAVASPTFPGEYRIAGEEKAVVVVVVARCAAGGCHQHTHTPLRQASRPKLPGGSRIEA